MIILRIIPFPTQWFNKSRGSFATFFEIRPENFEGDALERDQRYSERRGNPTRTAPHTLAKDKHTMLSQVDSSAILGIDAYIVRVEVNISTAMPMFTIVGLPDTAVQESRERVRSAIKNTGLEFPLRRLTINLAPADTRKQGPVFDLPIAVGLLAATGQVSDEKLSGGLFIGELALDGAVAPVSGVLPIAIKARADKKEFLVVPAANAEEAAIVGDVKVYPVKSLADVVLLLNDFDSATPITADPTALLDKGACTTMDFADVKGQEHVKRALEVAAAGGHNVLLAGPPGSGKTMLARRMPSILPPLTLEEALEVTKIYSVAGLLGTATSLVTTRPFRAPHHSVSNAALAGGGTTPRPGEVSLSHNGVLFLDELPEFRRDALEVLRQPLEDGHVTIARVAGTQTYPAQIMLVSAMNPCPCGYYGDTVKSCTCSQQMISKYLQRISGPLLDRIDIHMEVPRLNQDEMLQSGGTGESSTCIRQRVITARALQKARFAGTGLHCNAHMQARQIKEYCQVEPDVKDLLRAAITQLGLSARAYDRILKLARTVADLDGKENIEMVHVAESIQYRALDRKLWG
jgi:magnesium chelatase family protein